MNSRLVGTQTILLVCIVAYVLEEGLKINLAEPFALWPLHNNGSTPSFMPWQLVTYAFLHGSFTHLLFNMIGIYSFGSTLERLWGQKRFLNYFFACVITAGLTNLAINYFTNTSTVIFGASGAVFGFLLAFGLLFPEQRIMLLIPPIPMPARVYVIFFGALELFFGISGAQEGIAHFAHLGGMLGGYLMIRYGHKFKIF